MVCQIQKVLDSWYGCHMPCRVVSAEDEVDEFENEHEEVPRFLWQYVNHIHRHMMLWRRASRDMIDIVVKENDQYFLIQDKFYRESYQSETSQAEAMERYLSSGVEYFVCFHQD